ncbi:hypothetical protein [Gloeothece verrucosa]|uniref:Uncharacterized protein n=1 Tax=Gloeothece verrucosa (strain PCC 7822) TaxID=497965 RepID=E0UHB6_GLOV7|nr:hypothetical protein [Gloeothece verrucosa]ADN16830.1 conserved hypothetical protein [Gloeothece verrucosa PCC 7822]
MTKLGLYCTTLVLFSNMVFPTVVKALSFGEAVGIGAGVILIDQAIDNNRQRHRYVAPRQEYERGLEDGYNDARYDNPRRSRDYDEGYNHGRTRWAQGWRTPSDR